MIWPIRQPAKILYWLLILSVVGYSIWTIIRTLNQSYRINQQIAQLKRQITELAITNKNLNNLLIYYQSRTFQEVEARRRLGLKRPGEKVYIIPDHQSGRVSPILNAQLTRPSTLADQKTSTPNYLKWWNYIRYGGL